MTCTSSLENLICDFCSSPDVYRAYMAEDFIALEVLEADHSTRFQSLGAWAACRECTALIEAENWEALLERSWKTFLDNTPPELSPEPGEEEEILVILRHAHQQFRNLRKKPV